MKPRSQSWIQAHALALTVQCPACKAPRDEPCVGYEGRPLTLFPAHGHRIHVAEMEKK